MYEQMEIQGLKLSQRENEICLVLGKGPATKSDDFLEKFQRGRGVLFNPKTFVADFGNFRQGFLSMKLIHIRVNSVFRV